jgi:hypothetical protein
MLGRVLVEDGTRSGQPSSSRNEDNMVCIRGMVQEDCAVAACMLADALMHFDIVVLTCGHLDSALCCMTLHDHTQP